MEMQKNSKSFTTILHSKLARRFARHTVGLTLFIALVISTIFIYKSYGESLEELNKELLQVEHALRGSLALQLWQLNLEGLNLMLEDLLIDKDIVYVRLEDEKGKVLIEKGHKPVAYRDIERSLPLYYTRDKKKNKVYLGKLFYIATTEAVDREINSRLPGIIVAIFIFFTLFSLLILYLYWDSTVRHLVTVKNYLNKIRLGGYRKSIGTLKLDRPKTANRDELDDLTRSVNEMQREIIRQYGKVEYQSLHDELTNLPNRRQLKRQLETTIERCRKDREYGTLLSVDLDNFKLLNESMGHSFGDKVLQEVARRLGALCVNNCIAARISGDEFAVLQGCLADTPEAARHLAEALANKLRTSLSEKMMIEGHTFKTTVCIGITLFDSDAQGETVIKQADNALHHAKIKGPRHYAFFEPTMQVRIDRRLELEHLIERAIEKDLFTMHYQPKYDTRRRVRSAEALVRLHNEKGQIISPGEFIPVLEQNGAIVEVGERIIEKVFRFIAKHRELLEKSEMQSIAINVSPTQYNAPDFAKKVTALAEIHRIDPTFVIFEITEEVFSGIPDTMIEIMQQLTETGFRFSIDDFGTGYSSLRYLKNLPISELKIDKSFVDEIPEDTRADALVKTVINMAHNFGLDVVAEGVETEKQFQTLLDYRCDQFQGYLFSKPLSEKVFLDKLHENDND